MNRRLTTDLDWLLLGAIGISITIAMMVYYNVLSPDQRHHIEAAGVLLALLAMVACLVIDYRILVARSGFICVVIVLLVTGVLFFGPENRRAGPPPWMAPAHPLYPFYSWLGVSDSWLGVSAGLSYIVVAMTFASVYGPADAGARRIRCWVLVRALLALACAVVVISFSEWVALNSLTVGLVMMVFAYAKSRVATAMVFLAMLAATLWTVRLPEALYGYLLHWGRPGVEHEQWSVALVGLSFTAALSVVFIIVRGLSAARVTPDPTGRHLVIGIVAGFAFQAAFCAWGVVMSPWGLVPAGLAPLHMSFTGSSLVATLMGLGLILNVGMRGRVSGSPTGSGSPMTNGRREAFTALGSALPGTAGTVHPGLNPFHG